MPFRLRSLRTDLSISVLAGIFVGVTGRSITLVTIWAGVPEYWAHWLDDIFTGVVAGVVLFAALRNNSAKRRLVQERLREVLETNHNVRNALEVINSSHLAPSEAERVTMVADSVARIDRTLKEFSAANPGETRAGPATIREEKWG